MPAKLGAGERPHEVTLRPIVYETAFERAIGTVNKHLSAGHAVRVVIRPDRGQGSARELSGRMLDRIKARFDPDVAVEDSRGAEDGNWVMVLSPADGRG